MHFGQAEHCWSYDAQDFAYWGFYCMWENLLAMHCGQAEDCGSYDARKICILGLLLHVSKSASNALWNSRALWEL